MNLTDVLNPNLILIDLDVKNKQEAFTEMSNCLFHQGYITNVDKFIEGLYVREAEGKTGIGNFIAIPHSKSEVVNKLGVVIGINQSEIPWETIDGKKIKIIIMFAVGKNKENFKEHLKMLSLFAKKLGDDEVVAKLLEANSVEEILNAFN